MTTAADLITLALKDIQVLDETETPSAALMSDALSTLNQMLALWQVDKMFVYAQVDTTKAATGAQTYTIGTGGDFNITTPAKIDYAFLRVNNLDYPITVLTNFESFESISLKGVSGSFPEVLYFNPTYPLGTIYVYPKPTSGTFHLISGVTLPAYTASADNISLSGEYDMTIRFSLAEILAAMMGVVLRPDIASMAKKWRAILRRNNTHVKALELSGNGMPQSEYATMLAG